MSFSCLIISFHFTSFHAGSVCAFMGVVPYRSGGALQGCWCLTGEGDQYLTPRHDFQIEFVGETRPIFLYAITVVVKQTRGMTAVAIHQ